MEEDHILDKAPEVPATIHFDDARLHHPMVHFLCQQQYGRGPYPPATIHLDDARLHHPMVHFLCHQHGWH